MKTPSPISNVSRCLKPTPLPTCRPWPQRRAAARQMHAAHQRVERTVAVRESRVELDQPPRSVLRLQRSRQAELELRVSARLCAP